jgi:hypothetical protein
MKKTNLLGGIVLTVLLLASVVAAGQPGAPNCTTSSGRWQNKAFPAQRGTFTVLLDVTPAQANMDSVIGLSVKPAAAHTDLAVSVRFNAQGLIDASNGAAW